MHFPTALHYISGVCYLTPQRGHKSPETGCCVTFKQLQLLRLSLPSLNPPALPEACSASSPNRVTSSVGVKDCPMSRYPPLGPFLHSCRTSGHFQDTLHSGGLAWLPTPSFLSSPVPHVPGPTPPTHPGQVTCNPFWCHTAPGLILPWTSSQDYQSL